MIDGEYKPFNYSLELPCCEFILDSKFNIYKDHSTDGVHGNMPKACPDETTVFSFPRRINSFLIEF